MSEDFSQEKPKDTPRYRFPICGKGYSGWKDYDQPVLEGALCLEDQLAYLKSRLDLICFNSLDRVYLRSSSHHSAVNVRLSMAYRVVALHHLYLYLEGQARLPDGSLV